MKKIQLTLGFTLLCLLLACAYVSAQGIEKYFPPKPNPPRLVNDSRELDLLTPDQEAALEQKLVAYDDSTSNQICIVVVNDIGNYDINEYATALGRAWGVGGKEYNNGVMVIVLIDAVRKRRQVAIAPGYGLEGKIPDLLAKEIIQTQIIPNFRQNDIYRGLDEGTDAIIAAIGDLYKSPAGYRKKRKGNLDILLVVIVFVVIMIIISSSNRTGGGGMISRRGYRRWNDDPPIMWFPSGGGGSGWGGGSSGGFGGFGGGSFGGGGASGSW